MVSDASRPHSSAGIDFEKASLTITRPSRCEVADAEEADEVDEEEDVVGADVVGKVVTTV